MHYTLKSQSEQDYVIRLKACNEGDSSEADSPLRHFYEPEMEVLDIGEKRFYHSKSLSFSQIQMSISFNVSFSR